MLGFLKVFAQGVLIVVLLPLILAVLALYAVYCTITFIYMAVKSIIIFFMGGTPMGDLPEDVEAKRILMEKEFKVEKQQEVNENLTNVLMQNQIQMTQLLQQQQINNQSQPADSFEQEEPEPYAPEEGSSLEAPEFGEDDLEEINDD